MEFTFRDIGSTADVKAVVDFISKQGLGYPNYDAWVQRAESELFMAYKNAILAFSEGRLVGDLVFQPNKTLPSTLEIKNLRIHPQMRRRDLGHFMLRQTEVEAERGGYGAITADARTSQQDVIRFLVNSGYRILARVPLYESGEEDTVLGKALRGPAGNDSLITIASSFN